MSTVAAIYENGVFRPLEKVNLPEAARVHVALPDDAPARSLIEQTPDVSGGDACFARQRIPVWLVIEAWQMGWSDGEVLAAHPALRPEHLAAARDYYRAHRTEIDEAIAANAAA